jgi:hypothetical protein
MGDGYLPFERDHSQLARNIAIMKAAAIEAGRDPEGIEVTALGGTGPERIKLLVGLGVARMLLFCADIAALPGLGRRVNDLIEQVG